MAQHPPAWMEAFVDVVVGCMEAQSPMGSVGWRYHEEETLGELVVYPTPVALCLWSSRRHRGGPRIFPGFARPAGRIRARDGSQVVSPRLWPRRP